MKYKYTIVCSHRKSISVSISALNEITVKCPWGMHKEQIDRFLDSKADWIEKHVLENCRNLAANDQIIEKKAIYINGVSYPLIIGEKNAVENGCIYLKSLTEVKKFFIKECSKDFISRFRNLEEITGLYSDSVGFKEYMARWGCCDAKNHIIFDFRSIMLPENLQNYLIVHELCHIKYRNHSNAFWLEVEKFSPDYRKCRKQLKDFSFLISLY